VSYDHAPMVQRSLFPKTIRRRFPSFSHIWVADPTMCRTPVWISPAWGRPVGSKKPTRRCDAAVSTRTQRRRPILHLFSDV